MRSNKKLEKPRRDNPIYYRVAEFLTTFGHDPGHHDSFSHEQEFFDMNPLNARAEAIIFCRNRLKGIMERGRYFLPFATQDDFVDGRNAAYTITLSFIIQDEDGPEEEYILFGEDDKTTAESLLVESYVLESLGYHRAKFSDN